MEKRLIMLGILVMLVLIFILLFEYQRGGPPCPQQCTDSDGGLNYSVKGNCTVSFDQGGGGVSDYCINTTTVRECYCVGNELESNDYNCPYGCEDGACVNTTEVNCTDTDGGRNIFEKGTTTGLEWGYDDRIVTKTDYCIEEGEKAGRLAEYYCSMINGVYKVRSETFGPEDGCYKCEDGACINASGNCTDSDGGIIYDEQGTVIVNGESYTDYCFLNGTLNEYYCINNTLGTSTYGCQVNCTEGACTS